ncbi:hypothetical protein FDECE_9085 [Fusarium decemcellulare]|nr:hypothetical protein FDECE_9085 [Fusarium decemcellulare]
MLQVLFDGEDEATWEPEETIQEDAPMTVYRFWNRLRGLQVATGPGKWHIFKIHDIRPRYHQSAFLCQWVGYSAGTHNLTWEGWDFLVEHSPDQLFKLSDAHSQARAKKEN